MYNPLKTVRADILATSSLLQVKSESDLAGKDKRSTRVGKSILSTMIAFPNINTLLIPYISHLFIRLVPDTWNGMKEKAFKWNTWYINCFHELPHRRWSMITGNICWVPHRGFGGAITLKKARSFMSYWQNVEVTLTLALVFMFGWVENQ